MPNTDWTFHTRAALLPIGLIALVAFATAWRKGRLGEPFELEWIESRFGAATLSTALVFLTLATLSKWTQLSSASFSAQDFWLFEDMLRQMMEGAPFLTRFAPQSPGWVQHGGVHAFYVWYLAIPIAWIIGPTWASLIFNPLMISVAGVVLARLLRPRWGSTTAWIGMLALYACSASGKIIGYETHPESAYPLFLLLWAYGAGIDRFGQKPRWMILAFALLGGTQIKADGFLFFLPLFLGSWFAFPWARRAIAWSAAFAVPLLAFQFVSIREFGTGAWGPSVWQGFEVHLAGGDSRMAGLRWSSAGALTEITSHLLEARGGISGSIASIAKFFLSSGFLAMIALAPWVIARRGFWISVLPGGAAYGLLGGHPGNLMLYHAAPFLGLVWLWASARDRGSRGAAFWVIGAACLLGGGGLTFRNPSRQVEDQRILTETLLECVDADDSRGVVSSPLIGWVPRSRVFSDRMPEASSDDASRVTFRIFSRTLPAFEFPEEAQLQWIEQVRNRSDWVRLDSRCRPAPADEALPIHLWIRIPEPPAARRKMPGPRVLISPAQSSKNKEINST